VLAFAAVGTLSTMNGGYFPTAWGWVALSLFLVLVSTLILSGRIELGGFCVFMLAGLALFVGWAAVSTVWSDSLPRSVLEAQRGLVYLAALCAVLTLARRGSARSVFAGVLGAIAAVGGYALATRLFPDRFGYDVSDAYRLTRPLGYWNSLGIFAAMGTLLAVGFAAHARTKRGRALAAAVAPVLLTTLALTFSRGAWIALVVGALAAVALSPNRVRLATHIVVLAPPSALAVWLGSRMAGIAAPASPEATLTSGRRFLVVLAVIMVFSALMPAAADFAMRRVRIGRGARRALGASTAIAAATVVLVAFGSPTSLVGRATDSFRAPLPAADEGLDERIFTFSGNGRHEYWSIAWSEYTSHPLLGSGAGTYELYWTQNRPNAFGARDAHNLYLETLAELGPVGLLLLVALLASPFVAFAFGRRGSLSAAALGAYSAYVVHAGVDWDWEVPAVTLAALFCGAGVVIAARSSRTFTLSTAGRAGALGAAALLGAFAFVASVGNGALVASARAVLSGNRAEAEAEARKALRWAPWSAEAWLALGRAQVAQGREAAALTSFQEGVRRDRREWRLWYELAAAYEGADRERALAELARLNPRGPIPAAHEHEEH
jgi:O-antigen ligase/polysaccharide polymerase Wzy-like membrane protein/tetratricopeptide repeat protein